MSGNTIGQGFNLGSAELAKALSGNTQASEKFVDAAQKSAQALFTLRVSDAAGAAAAQRLEHAAADSSPRPRPRKSWTARAS